MIARSALARVLVVLVCLPACRGGVSILGLGVGVGIGAPHAEVELGLDTPAVRIDRHAVDIALANDYSYSATIETTRTLVTPAGVRAGQRAEMDFEPRSETLAVEEAWAVTPGGERVDVRRDQIITRPSRSAEDAPAFVSTETTTVLFPQLDVGAKTHVRWRLTSKAPPYLGFHYLYEPELCLPIGEAVVRISYPNGVTIRHAERGGFSASEAANDTGGVLTARLADWPGLRREPSMVAAKDVVPSLAVSSVSKWERIGALFNAAVEPNVKVTPEIQALADKLAGDLKGIDVAKAMHRYVCREVRYVAVWLDAGSSWVPHGSDEVLRRGYGDCKDQYVLLAALLRAKGIRSNAVLVNWDRSWRELGVPTPAQFGHCMAYLPDFDVYSNPVNPYANLGVLEQTLSGKFVVHATELGLVGRTPEGSADRNSYRVEHDVALGADGSLSGTTKIAVEGRPAARLRAILAGDESPEGLAEDLLSHTPEGGFGRIESTDPTDLGTPLLCKGEWRAPRAVAMGSETWMTTPVGTDFLSPQKAREFLSRTDRSFPTVVGAVSVSWRHVIRVPAGRSARLPKGRTVENAIGRFSSRYSTNADGSVVVERDLRIERDVVPPEQSPLLRDIFEATVEDARAPLVFAN